MDKNTLIVVVVILVAVVGGWALMNRKPVENVQQDTANDAETTVPEEDTTADVQGEDGKILATLVLNPVEGSETTQSGKATIQEIGGGVAVMVEVTDPMEGPQPAHLHVGACPGIGAVKYPLENLIDGASTTILSGVTAEQLKADLPLALNVHKSSAEVSVYTACGNVVL